jgi:hypothetical protein
MPMWVGAEIRPGIAIACSALVAVSCGSTEAPRAAPPVVVLVAFPDAGAVTGWTTVNDPVMGGRSSSTIAYSGGGLRFSGNVSLDNNGGFASARSPQDPSLGQKAAAATALRVHAVGDGKTYVLKVGAPERPWSYIQRFTTEAGIERSYDLPVADFQPVGMRLAPAPDAPQTLDPSSISQVALYILDKQLGPFAITVRAIDATA